MGKNRTLAFQVSEELFQQVKEYLERYEQVYGRRLTQREFIIGLIEQALEEAEEEFEAAGQEEQAANGWESGEPDEDTPDNEEPENWDGGNDTPGASGEEDRDEGAEPNTAENQEEAWA